MLCFAAGSAICCAIFCTSSARALPPQPRPRLSAVRRDASPESLRPLAMYQRPVVWRCDGSLAVAAHQPRITRRVVDSRGMARYFLR